MNVAYFIHYLAVGRAERPPSVLLTLKPFRTPRKPGALGKLPMGRSSPSQILLGLPKIATADQRISYTIGQWRSFMDT